MLVVLWGVSPFGAMDFLDSGMMDNYGEVTSACLLSGGGATWRFSA
jgi:hypothetical protein